MLELYNIDELPGGKFTQYLQLIDRYQQEEPFLSEKIDAKNTKRLFSQSQEYYRTCNIRG